jgi:ubiquinone/menaquinone biosynthesis C-methylase UbiE
MNDIQSNYTKEHINKLSKHLYPTEWVIRTMLGKYPDLIFDKDCYTGGKILDMGFGDGRNFQLFDNIGLDIYGIEITKEIIDLVKNRIKNINLNLAVGNNRNIPFNDSFFDIIVACSSFYYIDKGSSFEDNIKEYCRVLKKDGLLIANLPEISKNFICKNSINIGDNHIIIKNDIHNLRNDYIFRAFESKEEVINVFSPYFKNICIGYLYEEYFGYELSGYIMVATKK